MIMMFLLDSIVWLGVIFSLTAISFLFLLSRKYLLNLYYVPVSMLNSGGIQCKTDIISALMNLGEKINLEQVMLSVISDVK